jgi:hypothetical protein
VCSLCRAPADRAKDDIVLITCSVESCDTDRVYHAECTREVWPSSPTAFSAAVFAPDAPLQLYHSPNSSFVPRKHDSDATLSFRDCFYASVRVAQAQARSASGVVELP